MSIPEVFFRETIDLNRFSNAVAKKYAVTYNEIIVNAAKQLKQIDLRQQAADAGVIIAPQTRKRLRAIIKQSKDSLATWSTKSAIDFKKELQGVTILQKDFTEPDAPDLLKAALGGKADLVVSDMAAPTTGHKRTDHLRIIALSELAYYFARDVLNEGGAFLTKVFQGGSTHELLTLLKKEFKTIKHIKPDASRSDSAEIYVVAQGFKGKDESLYPETYDEDDFYP